MLLVKNLWGLALLSAVSAGLALPSVTLADQVYKLTAMDVLIENPSPLFTSDTVSGTITLADSVAPGENFGFPSVIAAFLDFGGITGTLADIQADIAPGPVQVFGARSADGQSLSMLDFRFGFPSTTPGCGFVCAGQIILNSGFDPSNFIALDDFNGDTLSIIDSFTPSFALVSEPAAVLSFGVGIVALAGIRHRKRTEDVRRGWTALS